MFWNRASQDACIRNDFRAICATNAKRLQQVAQHV